MSKSTTRDEYHHYIPRFILRRFLEDYEARKTQTNQQRRKAARKAQRKGLPDPDCILVFDLETGVLESRPIARVYGEVNFYQDKWNSENRNHLEEKLGILENHAARIISDIHKLLPTGEAVLVRKDSEALRKFLFLMHYRSNTVSGTYFQEDHPRNAPIKSWIQNFKKKRNFTSDAEVWLDGIKYYLETPHHTILAHSRENDEMGGDHRIMTAMGGEIDIDMEYWHAEAYTTFVNNYFLAVWEAADDSEFVLGHNTFGIWEGTFLGMNQLFRVCVVSPRVALIFKMNMSRNIFASVKGDSTLTDIPIAEPVPRLIRSFPPPGRHGQSPDVIKEFRAYVSSPEAQQDKFMFKITKLSKSQTYLINQIVLQNVRQNGSITFASRTFMLSTVRQYDTPEGPFMKENRTRFRLLTAQLSDPPAERTEATPMNVEDEEKILIDSETPSSVNLPLVKAWWESQADFALRETYHRIQNGTLTFRSDYDQALHILPLATNSSETVIREGMDIVIQQYSRILPVVLGSTSSDAKPSRRGRLVSSLTPQYSSHLFNLVVRSMESMGRAFDVGPDNPLKERVIHQVIMVGLLKWMVEKSCDVAEKLFPSVPFIEYGSIDESREGPTEIKENTSSLEKPDSRAVERTRLLAATIIFNFIRSWPDDDISEAGIGLSSTSTAVILQHDQNLPSTLSTFAESGVANSRKGLVNPSDSLTPAGSSAGGTFPLDGANPISSSAKTAPQEGQGLPSASSTSTESGILQPRPRTTRPTDSLTSVRENAEGVFDETCPVIGDQSADALIDAAFLQIMRGKDGFTSRYDRARRIFELASAPEDMENLVALTIRDAVRLMVLRVSRLISIMEGDPPVELPEGHLVDNLSFTESELLFVTVEAHPYFCHFPMNLGWMEGAYIGALAHDAVIIGVLSWLIEERSDVAKRRFGSMPGVFEFGERVKHDRRGRSMSAWLFCVLGFYFLYQPTVADLVFFALFVKLLYV